MEKLLRLGKVSLDMTRPSLRNSAGGEIALRRKSLDFLLELARNRGRVLSHDELLNAVWPKVTVTEDSIGQCVREVRRAIGDPDGRILKTIIKRGYCLDVEAEGTAAPLSLDAEAAATNTESDRPSLVVLPFQNIPEDPKSDWFSDGIVEDITTALSRFRSLFVIARNSAFVFKGKSVDVRNVGRMLGVRYVLEGSVRQAGGQLRVTGQLVEAETGTHVWADRFDGVMADVFELQDRITAAVAGALQPRIRRAEIERATRKPTADLTAYDLYLHAVAKLHEGTKEGNESAKHLLKESLARDPGFAQARSLLTRVWMLGVYGGWEPDVAAAKARAVSLAREALASDSTDPLVLARCGHTLAFLGRVHAEGAFLLDQAIAANPNCAEAYIRGAWVSCCNGDFEKALSRVEMSERLDPVSSEAAYRLTLRAAVCFFQRRFDAAIDEADRALGRTPEYNAARRFLACALALAGREEEARAQTEQLLRRDPEYSLKRERENHPYRHDWMIDLAIEGLSRAGVPSG
jgi:TolB-like protein